MPEGRLGAHRQRSTPCEVVSHPRARASRTPAGTDRQERAAASTPWHFTLQLLLKGARRGWADTGFATCLTLGGFRCSFWGFFACSYAADNCTRCNLSFTSVQPQTDEHLSSCVACSERRNPATSGTQNSANTRVYRAPQPSPPCPIPGNICGMVGTSSPWLTPVQPVHTPVPALSTPSGGPRWLKGRYTRLNS